MHPRKFSSIPGLYTIDVSGSPHLNVTIKNLSNMWPNVVLGGDGREKELLLVENHGPRASVEYPFCISS